VIKFIRKNNSLWISSFYENSWLSGFSVGDAYININIIWPKKYKNEFGQMSLWVFFLYF